MSIHNQIHKKLSEEIINLLKQKKVDEIEKIINEIHPADIADILEILNEKDNDKLKEIIENKKYAEAIIELDENVKNIFLSKFSADTIANDLINELESDDAVDIILELNDDKKEKVLSQIKNQSVLKNIKTLLKYESNTAGSLMATELIKVNYSWSNKKCIDEIRKQAKNIKKVHTIYVVNDNENIVGLLSLRKLLISDNKNISSIVNKKNLISVKVNETKESIINLMNKSEKDEWIEEEAIVTETLEYMEGMKSFFVISGVAGCLMALIGIFSVPVLWSGDRNLGLKMVAGAFSINLLSNLGAQFYLFSGPGFMPDYGFEEAGLDPSFMDSINTLSFVSNIAGLICCNLVLFSVLALVASQTKPMGPVELKSGFHLNDLENSDK